MSIRKASQPKTPRRTKPAIDKTIFIYGGSFNSIFTKYIAGLTRQPNPRICFIPTASGDNPNGIVDWYDSCEGLPIQPFVLRSFINSDPGQETFDEMIMSMDAIIVGGGSTLNMMAIWKAQGIDVALKKAYNKGIILAGGSAGSLCWCTGGYSDSRPKQLSIVDGMGLLDFSHCPHYHSEHSRKPLYFQAVLNGKLKEGYACDDLAGLLFVNGVMKKSLSINKSNKNYFISVSRGKIIEKVIPAAIIE